jgi:hypothetical protein
VRWTIIDTVMLRYSASVHRATSHPFDHEVGETIIFRDIKLTPWHQHNVYSSRPDDATMRQAQRLQTDFGRLVLSTAQGHRSRIEVSPSGRVR